MKREMKNIKENQVELLETKSIISEANNSWDEINIILDITEKKTSNIPDRSGGLTS